MLTNHLEVTMSRSSCQGNFETGNLKFHVETVTQKALVYKDMHKIRNHATKRYVTEFFILKTACGIFYHFVCA